MNSHDKNLPRISIDVSEHKIPQACIRAISGSETSECIHVIKPVTSYSLKTIHLCINQKKMQVNESIYDTASSEMKDLPKNVSVVTGYGTGGAVALMLAVLLMIENGDAPTVCSFGSPPVGDAAFNQLASEIEHVRVKLSIDPISTQGFGFEQSHSAIVIGVSFPSCLEKFLTRTSATLGFYQTNFNEAAYIQAMSNVTANSPCIDEFVSLLPVSDDHDWEECIREDMDDIV